MKALSIAESSVSHSLAATPSTVDTTEHEISESRSRTTPSVRTPSGLPRISALWLIPTLLALVFFSWLLFRPTGPYAQADAAAVAPLPDQSPGLTALQLESRLAELGEAGRSAYLRALPIDAGFVLAQGSFLLVVLWLAARGAGLGSRSGGVVLALPVLAALADLAENAGLAHALRGGEVFAWVGAATGAKLALGALSLLAVPCLLGWMLWRRFRR